MDASVIIPVLNEGERLRACLQAVAGQRFRGAFEVVVVDGGSDDGCLGHARALPVRVVEAPGTGAGEARNVGARASQGRVLVFTDADCIPQPGWLQGLLDALDAHPGWDGVGGGLRHAWSGPPGVLEDLESRAFYRGIITSNVAYRRRAFARVGGFDPRLRCAEDWDLGWRLAEAGMRIGFAPEAVVVHAPSEDERYGRFLRKQVWYARHDVPALFGTALGRRGEPGTGAGRRHARSFVRTATLHAVGAALVASVALAPVGAALLGAWALHRAAGTAIAVPEGRRRVLPLVAHNLAKALARGCGTWLGLAEWLAGGARGWRGAARPAGLPPAEAALAAAALPMEAARARRGVAPEAEPDGEAPPAKAR